jgi:hypothetical protein
VGVSLGNEWPARQGARAHIQGERRGLQGLRELYIYIYIYIYIYKIIYIFLSVVVHLRFTRPPRTVYNMLTGRCLFACLPACLPACRPAFQAGRGGWGLEKATYGRGRQRRREELGRQDRRRGSGCVKRCVRVRARACACACACACVGMCVCVRAYSRARIAAHVRAGTAGRAGSGRRRRRPEWSRAGWCSRSSWTRRRTSRPRCCTAVYAHTRAH